MSQIQRSQQGMPPDRNHCLNQAELYMRFALWAQHLPHPLSANAIADRYQVCRATAYRWRQAWAAACGVCYPNQSNQFTPVGAANPASTPSTGTDQ